MNYSLPSKLDYQTAQETIQKFEKRESEIKHLNNILGSLLKSFQLTQFKINKKNKEVIFSGVIDNKLVIGQSKCKERDVFEAVIGKVIAVKRALKQDTKEIEKFVESLPEIKYFNLDLSKISSVRHTSTGATDLYSNVYIKDKK
ncbi:hypothetical protein FZC83_01925 [Rossellomorea marisflavi]|uniref:Uncharacterized protein n=1 Tax=Rossellomorea marisflavi TaxID=189381 RepID=A0A5D4RY87_9BACI|nr:hypothetical protein [Rossellomorea marisflavi]TYS56353.1 hypothetical protein FZC83_01925 [Rossellomorea marisflavi]